MIAKADDARLLDGSGIAAPLGCRPVRRALEGCDIVPLGTRLRRGGAILATILTTIAAKIPGRTAVVPRLALCPLRLGLSRTAAPARTALGGGEFGGGPIPDRSRPGTPCPHP